MSELYLGLEALIVSVALSPPTLRMRYLKQLPTFDRELLHCVCRSNNCSRKCQKIYTTLCCTVIQSKLQRTKTWQPSPNRERVKACSLGLAVVPIVSSYAQSGSESTLLMTSQLLVYAPDGMYINSSTKSSWPRIIYLLCFWVIDPISSAITVHSSSTSESLVSLHGMSHGSPLYYNPLKHSQSHPCSHSLRSHQEHLLPWDNVCSQARLTNSRSH